MIYFLFKSMIEPIQFFLINKINFVLKQNVQSDCSNMWGIKLLFSVKDKYTHAQKKKYPGWQTPIMDHDLRTYKKKKAQKIDSLSLDENKKDVIDQNQNDKLWIAYHLLTWKSLSFVENNRWDAWGEWS